MIKQLRKHLLEDAKGRDVWPPRLILRIQQRFCNDRLRVATSTIFERGQGLFVKAGCTLPSGTTLFYDGTLHRYHGAREASDRAMALDEVNWYVEDGEPLW